MVAKEISAFVAGLKARISAAIPRAAVPRAAVPRAAVPRIDDFPTNISPLICIGRLIELDSGFSSPR